MFRDIEVNYRIRDREVRVVSDTGEQLGIMSSREAQELAKRKGLDLVKISPNAKPPVCKIVDYGKYKYDISKREKEQKKNQKQSELKEIWLSMTIEKHDLETKASATRKFILAGDKVKVLIKMRGRQQAHVGLGLKVMDSFFEILKEIAIVDKKAEAAGRNIVMILAPLKKQ